MRYYDSYLCHYGVKGQKWGVRRYQNPDGTLTPYGKVKMLKAAAYAELTRNKVNSISNTWSKADRDFMDLDDGYPYQDHIWRENIVPVKRIIVKEKNTPVAFFDINLNTEQQFVSVGTRSGAQYRNKGYAQKAISKGMAWYDKHVDEFGGMPLVWAAREDNLTSRHLATRSGFKAYGQYKVITSLDDPGTVWKTYEYSK